VSAAGSNKIVANRVDSHGLDRSIALVAQTAVHGERCAYTVDHTAQETPMIKLCGSAISNYYNKVKLALLEKGIAFEQEQVTTGSKDEAVLSCSPLGKVPFIRTPQGALCESEAIMGYLEAIAPNPPLLPADPYAAAKVRELSIFVDLHGETTALNLRQRGVGLVEHRFDLTGDQVVHRRRSRPCTAPTARRCGPYSRTTRRSSVTSTPRRHCRS
jgi:Glutathione S-transferase, N-terminal domain